MIVLNAGVPRSGTVLVNAILRKLFAGEGIRVAQTNPHGPDQPNTIQHLRDAGYEAHRTVLVHTHSWDAQSARLLAGSPHVAAILNYRDPRDVCVSLMRLHDHDFETAAEMTQTAFEVFFACARDLDPLIIPYELLVADPPAHIFQIARHLGLWPGLERVAEIAEETSIEHHRAHMEKVKAGEIEGLAARPNKNRVLVEDPKTMINDRHIQSGASGRWREELEEAQIRVANERFQPILKRYGYPL